MTLYEDAGGFDRILMLCRRWHELCLTNPVSAHPFDRPMHPQHDERLAAYLAEAFGGPRLYTAGYGDESTMRRMHAGNGEHDELDEICLRFFDQAIADVGIAAAPAQRIAAYFRAATIAQRAYPDSPDQVPAGLPFNHAMANRVWDEPLFSRTFEGSGRTPARDDVRDAVADSIEREIGPGTAP